MKRWPVQDAKARFSELVASAQKEGPQVVTRYGREAVVILPMGTYRKLAKRRRGDDLVTFFQKSPLRGLPEKLFERNKDTMREIDL